MDVKALRAGVLVASAALGAGDTAYNQNGVLAYGESITAGVLRCTSVESGMTCRELQKGHGFTISRQAYQLF